MHQLASIRAWKPWWRAIRELVFPEACIVCGGALEVGPLCAPCVGQLEKCQGPQCPRCALPYRTLLSGGIRAEGCPACRRHPPRFDAAATLGIYQGPLRHLCLRLKSPRASWLAPRLVDLLLGAQGREIRAWVQGSEQGRRALVVVPVPLHWWRRWRRGFNQSDALAAVVANRLGLKVCRALRRVRATPHLSRLSRTERKLRLRRAFQVRRRARQRIAGRDVILVDDILTTGATCNAAARTLKRAGAGRVYALVLARAKDF